MEVGAARQLVGRKPDRSRIHRLVDPDRRMPLKVGRPEGLAASWHDIGQKEEESHYKDGELDGMSTYRGRDARWWLRRWINEVDRRQERGDPQVIERCRGPRGRRSSLCRGRSPAFGPGGPVPESVKGDSCRLSLAAGLSVLIGSRLGMIKFWSVTR